MTIYFAGQRLNDEGGVYDLWVDEEGRQVEAPDGIRPGRPGDGICCGEPVRADDAQVNVWLEAHLMTGLWLTLFAAVAKFERVPTQLEIGILLEYAPEIAHGPLVILLAPYVLG